MGRTGIEPATLGLKVRLNKLQRTEGNGNVLHVVGFDYAASGSKMQVTETNLFAHPYAHLSLARTTSWRRRVCDSVVALEG